MGRVFRKTGIACKWIGAWLLATAGLLLYGETAPGVVSPDFKATTTIMLLGGFVYSMGYACCRKVEHQRVRS